MREILFQDFKAINREKRLLSFQEVFEKDGYTYIAERKTICRVKELRSFKNCRLANKWILMKIKDPNEPKRLSLLRVSNSQRCESFWRSKLVGTIYIMHNNTVLTILFLQVIKVAIKQIEFRDQYR